MTWLGIKTDITPVADVPGAAEWEANTRLRKQGEMQRRHGYLSTALAKQAGPIRYIISGNTTRSNWLTFNVDGAVTGFATQGGADEFPRPPDGPRIRRPRGDAGIAVAPVINAINEDPLSPQLYPAGMVTFTPNITYDGLSGPLIYSWEASMVSQFAQTANIVGATTNPTATYDFGAGSLPDNYEALVGFTVSTTLNGFSANSQYFFTVL